MAPPAKSSHQSRRTAVADVPDVPDDGGAVPPVALRLSAVATDATGAELDQTFRAWAVVALMGHQRVAGLCSEVQLFGEPMLRVDVPGDGETPPLTMFYGPKAIYSVAPTTEAIATALAARLRPAPVQPYELAPPRSYGLAPIADDPDDLDEDVGGAAAWAGEAEHER
jgi:hypothetical protein